jgi:hypothetical protein
MGVNITPLNCSGPELVKYCRNCGYNLTGLQSDKCPECGIEFDAQDPSTFRMNAPKNRQTHILIASYLPIILLSAVFWFGADSSKWATGQNSIGLLNRAILFIWNGCGPFAWFMTPSDRTGTIVVFLLFISTWCVWGFFCWRFGRIRKMRWVFHMILSALWFFAGFIRVSLSIT